MGFDPSVLTYEELVECIRELGRRGSARRARADIICSECGTLMRDTLAYRITCGDRCRQRRRARLQKPVKRAERLARDPQVILEEQLRRRGWLPDLTEGSDT